MIAMVMCAGEGTRLRPLTYALPKPMVPVANKPVLEYNLENLKRNGISEVVINLSYRPDEIRNYFKDGSRWGMKIHYSVEKKPLGTAGGVKKAEKFFRDDPDPDFLVTSGDGLTDFNFSDLIRFHRRKKSLGTIALRKVDSRFEYGVTFTNRKSRISKFVEKPSWGSVFSNRVNTGIYVFKKDIFRYIPAGRFYDFGNQVWPGLLRRKKPIFGFEFREFWTDIGNLAEYRRAQKAVLNGDVKVSIKGRQIAPKVWAGKNVKIGPGVKLQGPCVIGDGVVIGKGCVIKPCSAIGDRSRIGAGSRIKDSVLWNDVKLDGRVSLDNCIVGSNEKIAGGLSFFDGMVLKI